MKLVKDKEKKLILKMPDTAMWDDILYELYVKKKIAAGLNAADEGRVVSHEEARKRLLSIESTETA
jgi:predicted transcriptional regulator